MRTKDFSVNLDLCTNLFNKLHFIEMCIRGIEDKDYVMTITSANELQTSVDNLTTEKNSLTEQVTNLNAEVANLKEMATVGKNHIASLREDAVATYKKLMGDNADETIVTMLNAETTGITTLVSLTKDYQARLEEKFPLTCSKCGSKDVNRASSVTEDDTQGKKTTDGADTTKNSELPSTHRSGIFYCTL